MNEPHDLPPGLQDLLQSAGSELAPAAAKAKARLALGLPAVAAVTPAPPPAAPAAPAASSGSAAVAGKATVLKLVGVVALAGGAFVAGVSVGDARARQELAAVVRPAPPPPAPIAPPPPVVPVAPPDVAPPPVAVAPPEVVDSGAAAPAPKPAPKPAPEPADLLALELKLVDEARVALAAGEPAKALAAISAYERQVPKGSLRDEAQLLKLEALVKAGRRAEAQALGERLSKQTGSELVRDRIKGLLGAP